ncbi:hypothetical protein [Nostoc parmelioides]|nr:hypothetical protein [Nostoc parmelioides]
MLLSDGQRPATGDRIPAKIPQAIADCLEKIDIFSNPAKFRHDY